MRFYRLLILLLPILLFAGCGNFQAYNASDSGVLIEKFLPKDTWMVISINTKDRQQVGGFQEFLGHFSAEDTQEDFWERVRAGFEDLGLDYEEDIKPIIGDNGFRLVLAYSGQDNFVAMTVADREKADAWFQALVQLGDATELELGGADVYVTSDGEDESYMALLDDIMVVTSDSAELINAKGRLEADDSESLLDNELYTESVANLEKPYIGYVYLDFNNYDQSIGGDFGLGGAFSVGSYLLESEILAISFEGDKVGLKGYGIGDEEKIEEVGIGLDDIGGKGMYLAKDVPGENLLFYEESGSLEGLVRLWVHKTAGDQMEPEELLTNIGLVVTQYLGMDLEEELFSFLDKGYALAVHSDGNSVVPGVSVIIDVADDVENAEELISRIDAQLGSLVVMMGGAMTKSETEVQGGDFGVVSVDLEALGMAGGTGTLFSVPEGAGLASVDLLYGITDDKQLILTTYPGWELYDGGTDVTDVVWKSGNLDETYFFFDFQEIVGYLDVVDALKESLSEGIESLMVETGQVDWSEYLELMDSAVFAADAGRYEVEMRGELRLE